LILSLFKELKHFVHEPYKNMDWGSINNEFNKDRSVKRLLNLIDNVIDQKRACSNTECIIYPDLTDLTKRIFDLDVYTVEEAREKYGGNTPRFVEAKEKIEDLLLDLTQVYSEVRALANTSKAQRDAEDREHQRKMEWTREMAKYKLPQHMSQDSYEQVGGRKKKQNEGGKSTLTRDDPALKE
jgi:hypothetical protein